MGAECERLPHELLQLVVLEAHRADWSALGRLGACSKRWARACAEVRELCAEHRFDSLAPDVCAALRAADAGARPADGEGGAWQAPYAARTWLERTRTLLSERALVRSHGLEPLWAADAAESLPLAHVLRVRLARVLAAATVEDAGVLERVRAQIREHLEAHAGSDALSALRWRRMRRWAAELAPTAPLGAGNAGNAGNPGSPAVPPDLVNVLALEVCDLPRLPRSAGITALLLAAVRSHDLELAYASLLRTQRPLLSDALASALDAEFRATFDAALKYGLENH